MGNVGSSGKISVKTLYMCGRVIFKLLWNIVRWEGGKRRSWEFHLLFFCTFSKPVMLIFTNSIIIRWCFLDFMCGGGDIGRPVHRRTTQCLYIVGNSATWLGDLLNPKKGLLASIFFRISVLGVSWTSWGTRFQVGMIGADQRRYLRPDE